MPANIFTRYTYFYAVSHSILTVVLRDGAAEGPVGGRVGGHLQQLRPRRVVRVDLDTAAVIWRRKATVSRAGNHVRDDHRKDCAMCIY